MVILQSSSKYASNSIKDKMDKVFLGDFFRLLVVKEIKQTINFPWPLNQVHTLRRNVK